MRIPITRIREHQEIRLVFSDVIAPVKAELDKYELTALFGKDSYYGSINAVISAYERRSDGNKDKNGLPAS